MPTIDRDEPSVSSIKHCICMARSQLRSSFLAISSHGRAEIAELNWRTHRHVIVAKIATSFIDIFAVSVSVSGFGVASIFGITTQDAIFDFVFVFASI